ncbi:hypothetical protein HK104_002889 [Borealophlyctis nickersoniae]|nr:hypothetical protein HK104_002889 [Borealophlyctis nickersoniae]
MSSSLDNYIKVCLLGDLQLGRLLRTKLQQLRAIYPSASSDLIARSHLYHPSIQHFITQSDLIIANLECAVTSSNDAWPAKTFNFRTSPEEITRALPRCEKIHVSLGNNHILDYGYAGMRETVKRLREVGVSFAGAGEDREEALKPAIVELPLGKELLKIAFFSVSDHPDVWAACSRDEIAEGNCHPICVGARSPNEHGGLFLLDFDTFPPTPNDAVQELQSAIQSVKPQVDMVFMSVHWGPNYRWRPTQEFTSFARWLVDQGVDVIHGHSAHHIQGVEIYKGKPILYSCGDFLDDYAIDAQYRNNLSFAFFLHLIRDKASREVRVSHLDLIPIRINHMKVEYCEEPESRKWLFDKMKTLCAQMGTGRVDEVLLEKFAALRIGGFEVEE